MKKVLIAGGSGLIGKRLTTLLMEKGYEVAWLSRAVMPVDGITTYLWIPELGKMDVQALENCVAIINLAGAPIANHAWTPVYRKKIIESRTQSARCILKALKENPNQVSVLISSSAIGFYGDRKDEIMTEESAIGNGFLAHSTAEWEMAYDHSQIRTILFRIGVVLSKNGGALKEMSSSIPFGICPILGNGKQILSWIHLDDICLQMIHGIENENMNGVYNGVSPTPSPQNAFSLAIRKHLNKWSIPILIPSLILKLLMGERSSIVLNSSMVSSEKIKRSGYEFKFPTLESALINIYGK
ncbi:MAG: TIGR01777 family protein [Bacteroidetes bacterium]|nr:TIGR01777 family protein [Bacteroidota bacterium]